MGDYVPKERSLILHLSHVTLMPHLQVSFLHADPQNDQLKFWHIPYVTYFQLSDQIGLDKVIVISQKSFFLKKKIHFSSFRLIYNKCGCCCTSVILQKDTRHFKNSKRVLSYFVAG